MLVSFTYLLIVDGSGLITGQLFRPDSNYAVVMIRMRFKSVDLV